MDALLFINVATLIVLAVLVLLAKFYLPNYVREKGKNLATKEDVAEITERIESVRNEYAKQLELYKSERWYVQQNYLMLQEEVKLKVETFKKTTVDVARLMNVVGKFQIHISNRELAAAASGMAHEKENEKAAQAHWEQSLKYSDEAAKLYTEFREVVVELGAVFAILSVYFDPQLTACLKKVIALGNTAIELKMPAEEFSARLRGEYQTYQDLQKARDSVGQHYDTLWDLKLMTAESNRFFDLMKDHVKSKKHDQAGFKAS